MLRVAADRDYAPIIFFNFFHIFVPVHRYYYYLTVTPVTAYSNIKQCIVHPYLSLNQSIHESLHLFMWGDIKRGFRLLKKAKKRRRSGAGNPRPEDCRLEVLVPNYAVVVAAFIGSPAACPQWRVGSESFSSDRFGQSRPAATITTTMKPAGQPGGSSQYSA